jgi:hypothetical protein
MNNFREPPMDRKLLITIHLYLSAFLAPAILLVAISGGLYLLGIKGTVEEEAIYQSEATLDSASASLKEDVGAVLASAGVTSYSFEYVKVKDSTLYTRPTSSEHYIIRQDAAGLEVFHARPSLQSRLIELHKGHGPTAFKTFQKVFAAGLVAIILSGLWLGLSATRLRRPTAVALAAGGLVFGLLLI